MEDFKHNGYTVRIERDEDPMNPRREFDNLGTMVCFHGRYDLGDKHDFSMDEAREIAESKDVITLPLFLYDHSGITISTSPFSCPWDSGQVGFIFIEKDKVRDEYGWKVITKKRRAQIEKYLTGEVEEYDKYLTGDVYGYIIEDPDGEVIESVWGFFGYDYVVQEAKAAVPDSPPESKVTCDECDETEGLIIGPCPYASDIYNDNTEVTLCSKCYDDRLGDI